jgi:ABC-2 type transport system permease protein
MTLTKARIFLKKDFVIESSYKLNFLMTLLNSVIPVVSFFFIAKLVSGSQALSLEKYGGNYFAFALIGIAFTRFFQLAVETFSGSIKRAQMAGCLEAILSSQTDAKTVVLLSSVYSFLAAGIQLIFMFLIAVLFFDFSFGNTNVPAALVSLAVSMVIFVSLGIFSAAGTVVFKQGEPIGWLFGAISAFIGGAMFPVGIMPLWLQYIAMIFPITYALDAIRLSVLQGYSIAMLQSELLIMAGMSLVLFPLSLKTFEWAVEKGKRDGTLMQY